MTWTIFPALALIVVAGLYIFLGWRSSPKAYKAMRGIEAQRHRKYISVSGDNLLGHLGRVAEWPELQPMSACIGTSVARQQAAKVARP